MTDVMPAPDASSPNTPPFVPFADQAMYLAHVAGGQHSVMQFLWRYRRPVDLSGVMRFRENLAHGRLARLMRPARLPFGRHQWTGPPALPPSLPVAETPIAVAALHDWIDAQVELPLDPVSGPGWNLTLQPLEDGSTVISLVVSHCLADGMAALLATKEAALGERRSPTYSTAGFAAELLQVVKDTPVTMRALARMVRILRNGPAPRRGAPTLSAATEPDRTVVFPTVFMRIPTAEWDMTAKRLGANRFTFLTAITAAFGEALGRVCGEEVTLLVPINQREGQAVDGGNCVTLATLKVANAEFRGSLRPLQRRLQETLVRSRREPDPMAALLPLVPFVPKRAFQAAGSMALGALSELPVTCSHLGNWPVEALCIDGTTADLFSFRGIDRGVTVRNMEARQGVASLIAAVVPGYLTLNFVAYQPGRVTGKRQLQILVEDLLASYGLTGAPFDG